MRELADGGPGHAVPKVTYVSDVLAECPLRVTRQLQAATGLLQLVLQQRTSAGPLGRSVEGQKLKSTDHLKVGQLPASI